MISKLRLIGGVYAFGSVWVPLLWFVSSSMERHNMQQFSLFGMHWMEIVITFALICLTLISQFSLMKLDGKINADTP